MKKLPLCLLVAIAFVGCDKPEAEDADSKETATPNATPATVKATSPTPKPNDWMWKSSDGKPRNDNPLGSGSGNPLGKGGGNPLEQKSKK